MESAKRRIRIGILGGGPSGLFVFKRLVESGHQNLEISLFEKKDQLGSGMPYSYEGANQEHITNVSGHEIPEIVSSMKEWIRTAPAEVLKPFDMAAEKFNDYKVVPRLLFGEYLEDQFKLLLKQAKEQGIVTHLYLNSVVTDLADERGLNEVRVITEQDDYSFDHVVMTTGHYWPTNDEGLVPNYFDSPYPPAKLKLDVNFPVAIKGASLTAIDAIRTLARQNGTFTKEDGGQVSYRLNEDSSEFRLVMHSIDGMLPAIRFHLEDTHLISKSVLDEEEIKASMEANDGFVPLDFLFERNFKDAIREQDPEFYEMIKDLAIEDFVEKMMSLRERVDPFLLFRAEFVEAEKSIRKRESIYWKEALAELSFTLNYPAKYLSAEDMMRLKKTLMPLISIVIAFVPQSSCLELLALYEAGVLSLVSVDKDSKVIPREEGGVLYKYTQPDGGQQATSYNMFVDCTGQPHFMYEEFPFKSLLQSGSLSPASIKFRSNEVGAKTMAENDQVEKDTNGDYFLRVPGIKINDHFQVLDKNGVYSERIYVMAVPHIGGFNPDYSGLDFCEAASEKVVSHLSTLSSLK
ncbi:FAD/NAD(P)-binding protein [Flavitalea sp.]|nr:FAD/NAD(P)-binding protein [Flavitalea sp.]